MDQVLCSLDDETAQLLQDAKINLSSLKLLQDADFDNLKISYGPRILLKAKIQELINKENGNLTSSTTKCNVSSLDIHSILKENKACSKMYFERLLHNSPLLDKDLRLLTRTLCNELMKIRTDGYPVTEDKEALAIAILKAFPYLEMYRTFSSDDDPSPNYSTFFWKRRKAGERHSGLIENCISNIQKHYPKDHRKKKNSSKKAKYECDDVISEVEEQQMEELREIPPTRDNKTTIVKKMNDLYRARCHILKNGVTASSIIEYFPQYLEYNGKFIFQDFARLYQDSCSINAYKKYIPSLLMLSDKWNDVANVFLRSLLNIISHLGFKGCRYKLDPKVKMSLKEQEIRELIIWIHEDSNIEEAMAENSANSAYIICRGETYMEGQYYVVFDGHMVDMEDDMFEAVDVLFKGFYVFDLNFNKMVKKLFEFLDVFIYKLKSSTTMVGVNNLISKLEKAVYPSDE